VTEQVDPENGQKPVKCILRPKMSRCFMRTRRFQRRRMHRMSDISRVTQIDKGPVATVGSLQV